MIIPSKKEFVKLAKKGNLIPVYREIIVDTETPVSAFSKFSSKKYSFLLESVEQGRQFGRYSFIGIGAPTLFESDLKKVIIKTPGGKKKKNCKNPLKDLEKLIKSFKYVPNPGLPPFDGGGVGYLNYETIGLFENLKFNNPDNLNIPAMKFIFSDRLLIFDHLTHTLKIVYNAYVESNPGKIYEKGKRIINKMFKTLRAPSKLKPLHYKDKIPPLKYNTPQKKFENMVSKTKQYIEEGDIVQGVISLRVSSKIDVSPFTLYRALRVTNPSPYMFYLNFGDIQLIGASPETMVRVIDNEVTVKPIAGTRRTGHSDEENKRLAQDLSTDKKELAEHEMLVDLGRNDVGKISKIGTVQVKQHRVVEQYSQVMHLVSEVSGELEDNKNISDIIDATFPAGTVSGAPKIRAMEIIEELELDKRSFYAGGVGYFGYSGDLDLCITIRSILVKNKTAYMQAGAGIVFDSIPVNEYIECMNKLKGSINALKIKPI